MITQGSKKNSHPEAIWPGLEAGVPKPLMPYSPAIKAGGWVFIAGQLASDMKTGLAPEIRQKNRFLKGKLALESDYVLGNLADTIKAAGCDIDKDMVRIWQYFATNHPTVAEFEQGNNWPKISIEPYLRSRQKFVSNCPPSSSVGCSELMWRDTQLEVDMICFDDDHETKTYGVPSGMTLPPGSHAPALRRGDWVFLSAESALDWDGTNPDLARMGASSNSTMWFGSTVAKQTEYTLEKLARIAEIAGTCLEQAVKAEVYIGHPRDFAAMDEVWKHWFPNNPPARVVVPYMGMGVRGSRVEIALTLLANDATLTKKTIETSDAPRQPGHEPQAVKAGNFLFFSTQMAFDSSGILAEGMIRHPNAPWYGSPGQNQMRYMMKNVNNICEAAGTSIDNIVRRVCFHNDLQWFSDSIQEWASYFPGDRPVSTTIGIAGGPMVVEGANTLLDLIAYVPD
jgi:enamine deaminase RidA (YjgF/YER057c/UK114 family)|tara:strand:- start:5311 stop:6672 length:1362 start_codon:yes stop_codon:yes gene_type:complete